MYSKFAQSAIIVGPYKKCVSTFVKAKHLPPNNNRCVFCFGIMYEFWFVFVFFFALLTFSHSFCLADDQENLPLSQIIVS